MQHIPMPRLSTLIASALFVAVLAGCSKAEQLPEFSSQQRERGEIIDEFDRNQLRAVEKYKAIWLAEKDDPRKEVQMTTIAGELVGLDPANFDAYFAFLKKGTGSKSVEVRAVVVSALGKARGREAIDLLIDSSRSEDSYIAQEAMRALNYRLATAYYDPASADDKAYLEQQLPQLCSHAYSGEMKQFCDRPN